MTKLKSFIFFLLTSFIIGSCAGDQKSGQSVDAERSVPTGGQASVQDDLSAKNIVQIAMASADHSTLVAAVQAAGMADVLANPGPLTVLLQTMQHLTTYLREQ